MQLEEGRADAGGRLTWASRHCARPSPTPRATFVVDPQGVIRFVSVHDLDVGRNVDEVLRTLDALQTGELCPCNWKKGEKTLEVV